MLRDQLDGFVQESVFSGLEHALALLETRFGQRVSIEEIVNAEVSEVQKRSSDSLNLLADSDDVPFPVDRSNEDVKPNNFPSFSESGTDDLSRDVTELNTFAVTLQQEDSHREKKPNEDT